MARLRIAGKAFKLSTTLSDFFRSDGMIKITKLQVGKLRNGVRCVPERMDKEAMDQLLKVHEAPEFPEEFLGPTMLVISIMMIGKNMGPEFTRRWVLRRARTVFQIYNKQWREEYANALLSESWAREIDLQWKGSLEFRAMVFTGVVRNARGSGAEQRLFWYTEVMLRFARLSGFFFIREFLMLYPKAKVPWIPSQALQRECVEDLARFCEKSSQLRILLWDIMKKLWTEANEMGALVEQILDWLKFARMTGLFLIFQYILAEIPNPVIYHPYLKPDRRALAEAVLYWNQASKESRPYLRIIKRIWVHKEENCSHPILWDPYLQVDRARLRDAIEVWEKFPSSPKPYAGIIASSAALYKMGGEQLRRLVYIAVQVGRRTVLTLRDYTCAIPPDAAYCDRLIERYFPEEETFHPVSKDDFMRMEMSSDIPSAFSHGVIRELAQTKVTIGHCSASTA
uniref:Uncharacterized protein n=1 Tax=Trichuris muris TaxID=70415 RepID=A0A5S6R3K4_TRIMR